MNYEAHIKSVFETPELADHFMSEIVRALNDITYNGMCKINKVINYGVATVSVPGRKVLTQPSNYIFSLNKAQPITLDPLEKPQPCSK